MRGQVWSGNGSAYLLKKQKEFCISMVYVVHVCDMFFIPTLNISCCISMKKEHMLKKFRNTWKFSVRSFIFVKK